MQSGKKCGNIVVVKDEYPICPNCRGRMFPKIRPDTTGDNIVAYCRRCKSEYVLNIVRGQCSRSPCP